MVLDYASLGLRCGLECHQQLAGKKLFCECPAEINDAPPDYVIVRTLRAVAGETGALDAAAATEQRKAKYFRYHGYKQQNCLVDIDEEPPHALNAEALQTSLLAAKLLASHPVDEIQVMRKMVIDGSNVSGFQRTALIAYDGTIDVDGVAVGISTICLEEEAAKIVERTQDYDLYNLSRLGIPLIEIATTPTLTTPELVKKTAEKIGMLLRSTRKVKRGLGTIRQDVNISIAHGARVEIKGAQDLHILPKIVALEAERQWQLLQLRDELAQRAVSYGNPGDVTHAFSHTSCSFIQRALQTHQRVFGIRLGGCAGLLGKEINPNRRFGTEISEYTKVFTGSGIMHSDELPAFGITQAEVDDVKKKLGCLAHDAFVITVAHPDKAPDALQVVVERIKQAFHGVPKEVRNANADGTTTYLRPMPGSARMYPETDVPTIIPSTVVIDMPELIEDTITRVQTTYHISKDLAELLVREDKAELFEWYAARFKNIKPGFIAELLWPKLLEVKRKYGVTVDAISPQQFEALLQHLHDGTVAKEAVEQILVAMAKGPVDFSMYKGINDAELEQELKKLVQQYAGQSFSVVMGKAMEKYRGKVDGKKVSEVLQRLLH